MLRGSADPQREAAVATAERVAMEQAAQRMALLEKPLGADVEILNAFFDGASWIQAFDHFFLAHCPLFATFGDGGEYSLELTAVHKQFTATAELLLDKQLDEMAVSAPTFMSSLMSSLTGAPPQSACTAVAASVLQRLEECADFEKFGAMMRARYEAAQHKPENDCDAEGGSPQLLGTEDETFAHEQQQIREASERRRRARMEAVRRAEEAADELDAELERERITRQESCPHTDVFAGMCTLCGEQVKPVHTVPLQCSFGSAATQQPGLEPEPQRMSSPSSSGMEIQSDNVGIVLDSCWDGWEVGSVCQGIVSFWDTHDAWGKIKRLDTVTDDALTLVHHEGPTYKTTITNTVPGQARSTTVTRVKFNAWHGTATTSAVEQKEIYVHNTQLPMDATRRWLQ